MAHINLLPWRESRRAEHKKNYLTLLVALTTIAFSLMFIAGNVLDKMTGNQNYRNNFIEQQTAILDKQIKKIKNIKNIEVLPISALMGEAIKRISNSTSVSDLFK